MSAILPIPYSHFRALQNHAYRGTRYWDAALAAPPAYDLLGTARGTAWVRIDLYRALDGKLVVIPRPTVFDSLHSVAINAFLPGSPDISQALAEAVRMIGQAGPPGQVAIMGSSQAGYVAIKLGQRLAGGMAGLISVATFNTAPAPDYDAGMERGIGHATTNYRTVLGGTEVSALGYRAGDFVSVMGPLPGTTYEVEIAPSDAAKRARALSYWRLHDDPWLLPDDAARWRVKDISAAARANRGFLLMTVARAAASLPPRKTESALRAGLRLTYGIGMGLAADALQDWRRLDPCLAAQLDNFAGFARQSGSACIRFAGAMAAGARKPIPGFLLVPVFKLLELVLGALLALASRLCCLVPARH